MGTKLTGSDTGEAYAAGQAGVRLNPVPLSQLGSGKPYVPKAYTEGPWRVERQRKDQTYTTIGGPVAKIGGDELSENVEFIVGTLSDWGQHGDKQTEANAYLVSAAPDLYEVVKAELDSGRNFGGDGDLYLAARSAIARAEGRG